MIAQARAEEGHRRTPAFSQVPIELLFASLADVGGVRGACIASVLRDQFGARKQEDAAVPVKAIAEAAGVDADSVRRAIRRLVADGLFEATAPGRYRVTLDPSAWRSLAAGMAAFAGGQRADTGVRASGHGRPEGRTQPSGNPDTGVRSAGHGCPERRTPVSAPLIEEDFRRTQKTLSQSECEPPANSSRSFPDPLPAQPAPGQAYHPDATPEVRKELIDRADAIRGWGHDCSVALGKGADPEHVREALNRAEQAGAGHWNWVKKVLEDFGRFGIPKPKPKPGRRFATRADIEAFAADTVARMNAYEERQRQERLAASRGAVA